MQVNRDTQTSILHRAKDRARSDLVDEPKFLDILNQSGKVYAISLRPEASIMDRDIFTVVHLISSSTFAALRYPSLIITWHPDSLDLLINSNTLATSLSLGNHTFTPIQTSFPNSQLLIVQFVHVL